jgi:uncharacterized protein
LASYASCPRSAYLDLHGDRRSRIAPSEFMQKLSIDGHQYEAEVLASIAAHRITTTAREPDAALGETWAAMADGLPRISGAVLGVRDASGRIDRIGTADLLERVPGRSIFGDFHYEVVEIKTARRVKNPYRVQLAFYSDLLAEMQGVMPRRAHLILGDGRRETISLSAIGGRYREQRRRLEQIRAGDEPAVHICSTCGTCGWRGLCVPRALEERHISLVFGLQREIAVKLEAHGVRTIGDLARLDPAQLDDWIRVGTAGAERFVGQATALDRGEAVWRRDPAMPAAESELFFDVEGDPDHDALYLFGVLERDAGGERYHPFLAERPDREGEAFLAAFEFLEAHDGAPVYHYHRYERSVLSRLVTHYDVSPARIEAVRRRMRDLSDDLIESCYLPVHSYSLKSVARYLGFEWAHTHSSAVQSMVWFSSWLATGDRALLQSAVEYNADDCRATRVLKDWLAAGRAGAAPDGRVAAALASEYVR